MGKARQVLSFFTSIMLALLLTVTMPVSNVAVQGAVSSSPVATHMIINQVFGANGNADTPVSHDFIELYNPTNAEIDLAGYSIQYAAVGKSSWAKLNLTGKVPAHTSYLIQGVNLKTGSATLKCTVPKGDITWDQKLDNKQLKIALVKSTSALAKANPLPNADIIDFVGIAGNEKGVDDTIDAYEGAGFAVGKSKQKAMRRVAFQDTDNNILDFELVDYRSDYFASYAPRNKAAGAWTQSINVGSFNGLEPNTIAHSFTGDPKTTRTITWQTGLEVPVGMVEITPAATVSIVDKKITTQIGDRYEHVAYITGLSPGKAYRYRCGDGTQDGFSSAYTFTTEPTSASAFTFLHVSDTQCFDADEFAIWGNLAKQALNNTSNAKFLIHTGDIVESMSNEAQMSNYYDAAGGILASLPVMYTKGNHDQINQFSISARQHFTPPTNGATGVLSDTTYSFDYGDAHFICVNSEDTNYTAQYDWIKKDAAATTKKWKIAFLHDSPFSVTQATQNKLSQAFDEAGINLVLIGHNHIYMRSKPIDKSGVVKQGGTVYLESGAAGYKYDPLVDTKKAWQEVLVQPSKSMYSAIKVTKDDIFVKAYTVQGASVALLDAFSLNGTKEPPDEPTITIKNASGSAITKIEKGVLTCTTNVQSPYALYAALYDKDNRLIKISRADSKEAKIVVDSDTDVYLKVFLWDTSNDGMMPLIPNGALVTS